MANYSTYTQVGVRMHMTFGAATRPTSTEVTAMMDEATALINAEAMEIGMTDTFGVLRVIEINKVVDMITNMFSIADPEKYAYVPIELSPEEKRTIHMAQRRWTAISFSVKDT